MNQSTANHNKDYKNDLRALRPHLPPEFKEWYHPSYSKNLLQLSYQGSDQDDIQFVVDAIAHDCEIKLPHNAIAKKAVLRNLILNLFFLHCDSGGKHCLKIRTNEKWCWAKKDKKGNVVSCTQQYEILPATGKVIQEIIHILSDCGVIEYKKGYSYGGDSAPGKIKLTPEAAQVYFGVLNQHNIEIEYSIPVVWKDAEGIKHKPSPSIEKKVKGPLIDKYNKQLADFEITLDGREFSTQEKVVVRQFHDKSCTKGGRLYWYGQTIKSDDRKRILIDGQTTVSIDINATNPTIAYALNGLDPTTFENDPYYCNLMQKGKKEHRTLGKAVLMVLFNVSGSTKEQVVRNTLIALQGKDSPHREVVEAVLPTLPDDVSLKHIVTSLYERNFAIREFFLNEKGDSYYRLSKLESDALLLVIKYCTTYYIPVLTVHDCVIVREKDADTISKVYQDAISKVLGFEFAFPERLVSVE